MQNIDISIIVPVYNVEKYLSDCLESILQQNFHNYEIVCINDASTDNSGQILCEYASRYEQIRVFDHLENRGLSAARNTGLSNAVGKYVWFVDSDDRIAPDSLTLLFETAEKNCVDMIRFNMSVLYERSAYKKTETVDFSEFNGIYSGRELFCLYMENQKLRNEACRQFIRRSFLKEAEISFYNGILHEDELFSFLCAMKAQRVMHINRELYVYRLRNGSIMSDKSYRHAQSEFVVLLQVLSYWNSHVFSERENIAIGSFLQSLYSCYRYWICFGEKQEELHVGGYAEKLVYAMLANGNKPRWLTLTEQQIEQIRNAKDVIVYGAGKAAMDIMEILKAHNIPISAVGVSNASENGEKFCGVQVDTIDNISCRVKDAVVVLGVTEKYSAGIREHLLQLGYEDIITARGIAEEDKE